jgi:hypothetical protein
MFLGEVGEEEEEETGKGYLNFTSSTTLIFF